MVVVKVRGHNKCHRLVAKLSDCCLDLLRQRPELIIYNDHAIFADRYPNITATTLQHIYVVSYRYSSNFDGAEILRSSHQWQR